MTLLQHLQSNDDGGLLAWKHPGRQFPTGSQLLVGDGEVAILLTPESPPRLFEAGRHTLQTAVIPLLDRIVGLPFGGNSPYQAQLWYIRIHEFHGLRWGTPTPVQLMDNSLMVLVPLRGYGQFAVSVADPLLFFERLCRILSNGRADTRWLTDQLRGVITAHVKDVIAGYMQQNGGIMGLGGNLLAVSELVQENLAPEFAAYGLRLLDFYLTDISPVPGENGVEQIKDAMTRQAVRRLNRQREGDE